MKTGSVCVDISENGNSGLILPSLLLGGICWRFKIPPKYLKQGKKARTCCKLLTKRKYSNIVMVLSISQAHLP